METFSNINTYLAYAEQELTVHNYNEVDALVLAQLSYYPFEKIYKKKAKELLCLNWLRN